MASKDSTLTQERLKAVLHYDPETGVFTWITRAGHVLAGTRAGGLHPAGYIFIKIDCTHRPAHRLAFLYMEGKFPPDQVDHINRIRNDNRWCNLRHATQKENSENKITNTEFIGVMRNKKRNKWEVKSARNGGKQIYLGLFKTHFAACYARWAYDHGEMN